MNAPNTDEEIEKLVDFINFGIIFAEGDIKMYQEDKGTLWPNWEELVYGNRCKISAYKLILEQIEKLSK
jgi:hypothetical protein